MTEPMRMHANDSDGRTVYSNVRVTGLTEAVALAQAWNAAIPESGRPVARFMVTQKCDHVLRVIQQWTEVEHGG